MKHAWLLILLVSGASNAEDPFACVDSDVADAFLGNWFDARPEYSTAIPDELLYLDVPDHMSLVGSRTRGQTTTIVFKTNMGADHALSTAISTLGESGWVEHANKGRLAPRGFQTRSRPATTLVCHEDRAGALSLVASDSSGQTLVSFMRQAKSQICDDEVFVRPVHDPMQMMNELPVLKLPDGVTASHTGTGGDGDEVSSNVDISGAVGRSELQSYFEDQIRAQRWEFQSGWSSRLSSGSVWTLDTAEEGVLIGTLHVFGAGTDPIRVRFSASPVDPEKGTDRGSWSSTSN